MDKFANFKAVEDEELEAKRDAYWDMCQKVEHNDTLDRATEMWIRGIIDRNGWLRSKVRSQAIQATKLERGKYACVCCGAIVKAADLQVDHKKPRGYNNPTLIEYVARTFCTVDKLAAICVPCHKAKSAREREHYKK